MLTTIFLSVFVTIAFTPTERSEIVKDVTEISAPGIPGGISLFDDRAFAVVVGRVGRVEMPVVAASTVGDGRMVAFGHDGYLGRAALLDGDTGKLFQSCIRWAGKSTKPKIGCIGALEAHNYLVEQGYSCDPISGQSFSDYDVVISNDVSKSGLHAETIKKFIENGGGFIAASTGWGWKQITQRELPEHPMNKILVEGGIIFNDFMLERTTSKGFDVTRTPSQLNNALDALKMVIQHQDSTVNLTKNQLEQSIVSVLSTALCSPASNKEFHKKLAALLKSEKSSSIVTHDFPITFEKPLSRIRLALEVRAAQTLPAKEIKAHPSAHTFPGVVPPEAPRATIVIAINLNQTGWHSTGLYAAPGEVVQIEIPERAVTYGLSVRIGCHTDSIFHLDEWKRAPVMTRAYTLNHRITEIANAFGGLLYIESSSKLSETKLPVKFSNAIEAPLYIHGVTSKEHWLKTSRYLPAPWAEIGSEKIIITVPSALVRNIENPETIAAFWDEVVDACADLSVRSRNRTRPERIVADVQISAGYMHAGYPIMTHLDVAPLSINVDELRQKGSWGHFHEIGHNHQSADWTFEGTGEVTVNLFTMYVFDKVLGLGIDSGHSAIANREQRIAKLKTYIQNGSKFDQWKADPFLALSMYIQMIEAFRWDSFKTVFKEYQNLSPQERPKSDSEKRDQWLIRYSRVVGRDLSRFFEIWGVPTSEKARHSLSDLPEWLPDELKGG
ncbi:MAG: M60 family metallopeptidase [Candidatus Nitrosotenuis sp.]